MSVFEEYLLQNFSYENYFSFHERTLKEYNFDLFKNFITQQAFNLKKDETLSYIFFGRYYFSPSTKFKKINPPGKTRIINSLSRKDKFLDRLTFEYIIKYFNLNRNESKSVHSITKSINNNIKSNRYKYFLRLDIHNYFPSINRETIISKLACTNDIPLILLICNFLQLFSPKLIFSNELPIIKLENNCKFGIPLGSAISQSLADLYLKEIDNYFDRLSTSGNISYHRYADDFCILTSDKNYLEFCKKEITKMFSSLNLIYSPHKLQFGNLNAGFDFLGFFHYDKQIYIASKTIKKIKSSIYTFYRYKYNYFINHFNDGNITYDKFLMYISKMLKKVNNSISGFNLHVGKKDFELKYLKETFSLSRYLSISDDVDSISFLQTWLSKLNKYFMLQFLSNAHFDKNIYDSLPKIVSLKNWYFRYRKDLHKAIKKSLGIRTHNLDFTAFETTDYNQKENNLKGFLDFDYSDLDSDDNFYDFEYTDYFRNLG